MLIDLALKVKLTVCSSLLASAPKVLLPVGLGDIKRDTKVIQWQRHEEF